MGDAAGIGPEIAVRALADVGTYRICRPLLIGDSSVILIPIKLIGFGRGAMSRWVCRSSARQSITALPLAKPGNFGLTPAV